MNDPRFAALVAQAHADVQDGRLARAVERLREALALQPRHAEVWHNVGVLEARSGNAQAALDAFDQAAALRSDWAEPHHARGQVAFLSGDYARAAEAFEAALARDPDHVAANVDLAQTLVHLRRYSQAVPCLQRARVLASKDETIWWRLRGVLLLLRRDEDALADFLLFEREAARTSRVRIAALASARRRADPAYEARALGDVLRHDFAPGEADLVAEALAHVQYHDVAADDLLALYDRYDDLVHREIDARGEPPVVRATARDARTCIGYLSADFRAHVMGELLLPVIAAHDRTRFRVCLFSLAPAGNADAATERFRAASDALAELAHLDERSAAAAIAAEGVDVLIDLMGHSAFARPAILARKPARRIVTHLGYHGAVGLREVDWKISDAVADLPDGAGAMRERVLPLDVCVMPLRPYAPPREHYDRGTLGLPPQAVVIAAFVGAQKLAPRTVALWRRILDRVPDARLLVSPLRDDDAAALVGRLTGLGIDAARIARVPYEPAWRDARYALADLALDTLPYSGGDTTAAALAAGVPVVTRIGSRHAERVSASILAHAGLHELIADGDERFVEIAVRLAADAAWRATVRAGVREALGNPDLSSPARHAAALERACLHALTQPPRAVA